MVYRTRLLLYCALSAATMVLDALFYTSASAPVDRCTSSRPVAPAPGLGQATDQDLRQWHARRISAQPLTLPATFDVEPDDRLPAKLSFNSFETALARTVDDAISPTCLERQSRVTHAYCAPSTAAVTAVAFFVGAFMGRAHGAARGGKLPAGGGSWLSLDFAHTSVARPMASPPVDASDDSSAATPSDAAGVEAMRWQREQDKRLARVCH